MEKTNCYNDESIKLMTNKLSVGDWHATCNGKRFKVNHNGIKLLATEDEGLEKVIFDPEKKTVSVEVKNPLIEKAPRTLDLSNDIEFFEGLRNGLETLLTTNSGEFTSVTINEDKTIFEIKG